jgi:hypothetical protein
LIIIAVAKKRKGLEAKDCFWFPIRAAFWPKKHFIRKTIASPMIQSGISSAFYATNRKELT